MASAVLSALGSLPNRDLASLIVACFGSAKATRLALEITEIVICEPEEPGEGSWEEAVVIDVPGCTCPVRSQAQMDRGDVCDACVSYFDLEPTS